MYWEYMGHGDDDDLESPKAWRWWATISENIPDDNVKSESPGGTALRDMPGSKLL